MSDETTQQPLPQQAEAQDHYQWNCIVRGSDPGTRKLLAEAGLAPPPTMRPFWLLALAFTLFSLALQWGGLRGEAVIDDHGWLHDPVGGRGCDQNALDCFAHPQLLYYYRPLVAVSFVLGNRWHHIPAYAPNEAYPFHVENLFLHGLAVLLVFGMFRLLFRRDLPALLGGALFALHPLNVPVTTFIGGRPDNMALVFLALFVIGLLKGSEVRGQEQVRKGRRTTEDFVSSSRGAAGSAPASPSSLFPFTFLWRLLSVLAFAGALFTKEQCVLLIALAPLLANWYTPRIDWRSAGRRMRWLGVYALPVALHQWRWHLVTQTMRAEDLARHATVRSFFSHADWSLTLHVEMIGRTCWYYACCFLFPTVSRMHQSTLGAWDWAALGPQGHAAPGLPAPPSAWLAAGGYAFLLLALGLLKQVWPDRAARVCWLWLFLTLIPCLNFIPVPSQFIAPYRALIPLVGVCGLAGAWGAGVWDAMQARSGGSLLTRHWGWTFALPLAFLVALACAWGTLADVPQWKNDGALMRAELSADPNFVPAHTGVAYLHDLQGDTEGAIANYDIAVHQLLPEAHTTDALIRAGTAPDMPRRVASASSLRYNDIPYLAMTLATRGGDHQRLAHWNEAAEDYRAAYALNPKDNTMGDWLAYALDKAGRLNEEEPILQAQIARRADQYRLSQLGSLYFREARWELARDTLSCAFRSPPSDTGAVMDITTAQRQYNEAFVRALKPGK